VEETPASGDTVIAANGVSLFLPEASCALLRGYTIDFSENAFEGGLSYSKPGAAPACGCGSGSGQGKGPGVAFLSPDSICRKAS
jgi:Fe-S cluster assembly iron-binding protein IscA